MATKSCKECGAELRLRSTLCPLCGSEEGTATKRRKPSAPEPGEVAKADVDDYQAYVRRLRDELNHLRKAEAS